MIHFVDFSLYENIAAKKRRIDNGSGESMRKAGVAGRPTAQAFTDASKTVKKKKKSD